MSLPRLRNLALAAVASVGLTACVYDDYGYGYGGLSYGYGGYGGYGGYYDPFYSPGYYGWYDNFYYPGSGIYVYDRYGSRHRWNDHQRHYWEGRRDHNWNGSSNWSGYRRDGNWSGRNWSGSNDSWRNRAAERAAQQPVGSPERQSLENYVREHGTDWRKYRSR
jgi:hypothetical protein